MKSPQSPVDPITQTIKSKVVIAEVKNIHPTQVGEVINFNLQPTCVSGDELLHVIGHYTEKSIENI